MSRKIGELRDSETGEPIAEMIAPANALSSGDALSEGLYALSETIIRGLQSERDGGGLGGRFGYGANFENEVFMMHPFCWCEQPDCLWCMIWLSNQTGCSEDESRAHRDNHIRLIREKYGDWCADQHSGAPHFWHKPSGFQVRWYKWIGRDMEVSDERINGLQWGQIMLQCFESLPEEARAKAIAESEADAKREADPEYQRQQQEGFNAMMSALDDIHDQCEREGHDDLNGHCQRCGLVTDFQRFTTHRDASDPLLGLDGEDGK